MNNINIRIVEYISNLINNNSWSNQFFVIYSKKLISIKNFSLLALLIQQAVTRLITRPDHQDSKSVIKTENVLTQIAVLGSHFHEEGKYHEYIELITWAKSVLGDHLILDYHEGIARVGLGDMDGWKLLATRRHLTEKPRLIQSLPTWDGQSDIDHLLVWWLEGAGIGGEVMRLVFLPQLLAKVKHIGIICDPRLHPVLLRMFPNIKCYDYNVLTQESANLYEAEIDLIHLTSIYLTSTYQPTPILAADPREIKKFQTRTSNSEKIKCGISWFTPNIRSQEQRSIPAHLLATWMNSLPNVEFYALQHHLDECEEFQVNNDRIKYLVDARKDIGGLLALATNMDVIVTIGNSTAHLAGALGVPTLVLLPHKPRFQWGITGDNSPFYKNMTLIRQHTTGDWTQCLFTAAQYIHDL